MGAPLDLSDEPRITINGTPLTPAQAMTVRVALTTFLMNLADPDSLGEIGPVGSAYQARLQEINGLIFAPATPAQDV